MKKNTLKRMMAGSLALLTVAAYVPVSAIELVPARDAIVANAAITRQRIYWVESSNYMTKLQYGSGATDFLSAGDIAGGSSYNTVVGNQVTITSKVPLEITPRNQRYIYSIIDDAVEEVPNDAVKQYTHGWTYNVPDAGDPYFTKEGDNEHYSATDVLNDISNAITTELKLDSLHTWYFSDADGKAIFENDIDGDNQAVNGESVIGNIKNGEDLYYTVLPYQKSDNPVIDQACFGAIAVDTEKYKANTNENGEITSFTSDNKTLTVDEVKEALLKDNGYYDADVLKDNSSFYTATGEEVKLVSEEEGVEPELQLCGFTKDTLYLLVGFSYTATAENDGTYSYSFTMPDAELDVTPTTSGIDLSFFESNEKKAADDAAFAANATTAYDGNLNRWGKDDNGFDDYWKDLTFGTVDEDFDIDDVVLDDEQTVEGIEIPKSYELKEQVIGTEMTVSCSNPFTLKINDQNDKQNWLTPEITYNTTSKRFQAKFIVPASASKERLVEFQFIKVDEEYTFTEKGTQLLATTKTGSITNAIVANLNVEYFANKEDVDTIGTDGDKGTVVPSTAIKNGNWIAFTAGCAENILTDQKGDAQDITVIKDNVVVNKYTEADAEKEGVYYDFVGGKYYTIFNIKKGTDGTYTKVAPKGGTYTVSYKVTEAVGKTPQAHTLTKSFTIAAKDSLKAEDVTLTISATKDNVKVDDDDLKKIFKTGETAPKQGKTDGVTSFMLADGKSQEVDEAGYQFTITPTIAGLQLGTDFKAFYSVSGSQRNNVYTIEIRVYDAEYGGSASNPKKFNVQWSVTDFEDDAKFKDFGTVTVAAEDVETLEGKIFDAAAENDPAKALKNQVEYLYVDGHNGAKLANGAEIELDNYSDGLPSEIGEYTVYVLYDGVVVSQGNVTITAHGVKFAPAAEDLALTYGEQLDFSNFTLTDADNKTPKNVTAEEIKVQVGYALEEGDAANKTTRFVSGKDFVLPAEGQNFVIGEGDGKSPDQKAVETALANYAESTLKITTAATKTAYVKEVITDLKAFANVDVKDLADKKDFLDAGVYAVQFDVKSSDESYAITSEVSTLTVSKKKISDPSVQITIDPIKWDGEAHNIVTEIKNGHAFYAKDTQTGDKIENFLKVTEGQTVADVKNYQAKVKVVDGTNWNYEGTTTANWNIVYKINQENLNTGLAWAEKMTTLYDNGRIHLEINRNANDKFLPNGTSIVIEEYGVVYENSAKIAPPVNYLTSADREHVYANKVDQGVKTEYVTTDGMTEEQIETQLQLGNGYGEGAYTTTTSYTAMGNTTFKGNFRVKSVDVGIWARPYILLKDTKTGEKTVVYGDIKYVNLEEEAKTRLNLQMNMAEPYSPAVREADLTDAQRKDIATKVKLIKGGYDPSKNRYYAYATFEDLETAGFGDVLQVTDFGVVLDSQGNIPADDGTDELKEEVKKTMLISNKKLKVGHYSKDNKVLKYNEFAANIKPKDSVTGVWVRPYLDLGNDLIVYGEPKYVTDVSSYFNGVNDAGAATFDAVPQVRAEWRYETQKGENNQDIPVYDGSVSLSGDKEQYGAALTAVEGKVKAVPAANKDTTTVTLVKVGTIADKYEALYTLNDKGEAAYDEKAYYTGLQAVDATKAKAAGFNYGTKSGATVLGDNNSGYKGRITPVHGTFTGDDAHTPVTYGKDLVVRQFAVYEIKVGTEEAFQVTVYGDIRQFVCNDVFNQATKFGSTYENIDVRQ